MTSTWQTVTAAWRRLVPRLLAGGRRPTWRDHAVTLAFLVLMVFSVLMKPMDAPHAPDATTTAFLLLSWLPLVFRIRWPAPVLAVVLLVELLHLALEHDLAAGLDSVHAVGAYQPVPLGTMLAVYTVAASRPQRDGLIAGGVATVVLFATSLIAQDPALIGTDTVMAEVVLLAAGVGVLVRGRAERLRRREWFVAEQARQAVLEERLRIARELHDTLAHNLALVDAQAGVADYLLDTDPEAARTALRGITSHTSTAIDDLRATLTLLRSEPAEGGDSDDPTLDPASRAPVARLDMLPGLLERTRASGVRVGLAEHGEPVALSHQSDLAAYRIVQEAITNAAKHAPGATIDVSLAWSPAGLGIEVGNRLGGSGLPAGTGTGHGLVGLRERARAAGGTLEAGPTGDGRFLVAASLPVAARPEGERP